MLTERIPTLMSMLPTEELELNTEDISGGVFDLMSNSPFSSGASEGLYYSLWLPMGFYGIT